MKNILKKIKSEYTFFDGAMGTFLQKTGLKDGEAPEELNIINKELIEEIHLKYLNAGCDVLTTNTFGANRLKMTEAKLNVETVITEAVNCAKNAIKAHNNGDKYIALDLGPIGQLVEPVGNLKFDEAYEIYKEQILIGEKAGCDLLLFETQLDIYELKAGILAAKENTNLPIFCTMTFDESGRTVTGTDVESMVTFLNDFGVDVIGLNCSFGPNEMVPLIKKVLKYSKLPVMVQPNAGLPKIQKNITVYDFRADEFVDIMEEMANMGARVLGGCCGTDDEYILKLVKRIKNKKFKEIKVNPKTVISSNSQTVIIGEDIKVIGERLNPTGKKRLKHALKTGDIDYVLKEGIKQVDQRADILDINVGLPELNEPEIMVKVIKEIQSILSVPLQIDSANAEALEKGARYYNGKALINSVNGKEESLNEILPIVKKYGCCVLGLTLDDTGIPKEAEKRYEIAKKIVNRAVEIGIPKENILIDCLVLTASAQQKEVNETLKAVKLVKENLGVKTVLGVSNVSFGLPNRDLINRTFLAMAINSGLDAPIMNPGSDSMMSIVDAANVLLANDIDSEKYIELYSNIKITDNINKNENNNKAGLKEIILKGLQNEVVDLTIELLKEKDPLDIINNEIIPALDIAGERYEKQEIFLPQLIKSAETVNKSFDILKTKILESSDKTIEKGTIVLATVKNDIHDIGKNIVKVIIQSYGYNVVDLGKDVDPNKVVEAMIEKNIKIIGLSALMTTTVKTMEDTILLIKKNIPDATILVGGAVLNNEYSDMIGATYYCRTAKDTVEKVKEFYSK